MGLDSVELIMEVEKAFDISIPDAEAERIFTVGQFHDVVWSKVQHLPTKQCNTQHVFYRLRRTLARNFDVHFHSLKTTSSLNEIFPYNDRREKYRILQEELALELPPLRLQYRPRIVLNVIGGIIIIGTLAGAIICYFISGPFWIYFLPVAGICLTSLLSRALNPVRTVIYPDSLRAFAKQVFALNVKILSKQNGLSRKEVEIIVNQIIVDKIGVDPIEVVPDARITDDLGVD